MLSKPLGMPHTHSLCQGSEIRAWFSLPIRSHRPTECSGVWATQQSEGRWRGRGSGGQAPPCPRVRSGVVWNGSVTAPAPCPPSARGCTAGYNKPKQRGFVPAVLARSMVKTERSQGANGALKSAKSEDCTAEVHPSPSPATPPTPRRRVPTAVARAQSARGARTAFKVGFQHRGGGGRQVKLQDGQAPPESSRQKSVAVIAVVVAVERCCAMPLYKFHLTSMGLQVGGQLEEGSWGEQACDGAAAVTAAAGTDDKRRVHAHTHARTDARARAHAQPHAHMRHTPIHTRSIFLL